MNENIDLTKILEGCPEGMKFYSSVYGEVAFVRIRPNKDYPIELKYYPEGIPYFSVTTFLTRDGRMHISYDGECTLFPSKDQRDWSKFERFWDKPKVERFDPKTLQPFDKVLARGIGESWKALTFSHKSKGVYSSPWCCDGYFYDYCIPYNEETKHLVGTTKEAPEYYRYWED